VCSGEGRAGQQCQCCEVKSMIRHNRSPVRMVPTPPSTGMLASEKSRTSTHRWRFNRRTQFRARHRRCVRDLSTDQAKRHSFAARVQGCQQHPRRSGVHVDGRAPARPRRATFFLANFSVG
jgi:hypothetical protein